MIERLDAGGLYYASVLAADGRIYALSEDGEGTVVAAKPSFEVLATNRLGERTMATPAIVGGSSRAPITYLTSPWFRGEHRCRLGWRGRAPLGQCPATLLFGALAIGVWQDHRARPAA